VVPCILRWYLGRIHQVCPLVRPTRSYYVGWQVGIGILPVPVALTVGHCLNWPARLRTSVGIASLITLSYGDLLRSSSRGGLLFRFQGRVWDTNLGKRFELWTPVRGLELPFLTPMGLGTQPPRNLPTWGLHFGTSGFQNPLGKGNLFIQLTF